MAKNILTTIRPLNHLKPSKEELFRYIDLVKEAGCDAINFNFKFLDKIDKSSESWESLCEDILMYLQTNRICIPITHSYYENLMDYDGMNVDKNSMVDKFLKCVYLSKKMGASTMVVHPFVNNASHFERNKTVGDNVEFFLPICSLAKKLKINIALENNVNAISKTDDKVLEPSVDTISLIADEINKQLDSKVAGICFDCGHANLSGYGVYDELRKCGDNLMTLHLHNNVGITTENIWANDNHNAVTDGVIKMPEIMDILHQMKFKKDVVIESVYKGMPNEIVESIKNDQSYISSLYHEPHSTLEKGD